MMHDDQVGITAKGAVLLGPEVSCDGFHIDRSIRVQTHWHTDHMSDFGPSKRGDVVMSEGTFELLRGQHRDFDVRVNIHRPDPGVPFTVGSSTVRLEKSNHCLGSVQASVQLSDGRKVGYSGDFSWPLDRVIKVDSLVLDATYGDPSSGRSYDQHEAEEALVSGVRSALERGPVQIIAHGGVTERALSVLDLAGVIQDLPVLAGERLLHSIGVHRDKGYSLPAAVGVGSEEGLALRRNGSYVRCWGHGQSMPNDVAAGTRFVLTKYRAEEVMQQEGHDMFRIGFSNHADFGETMEYVRQTGAKFVLTDGTRSSGQKARALAAALSRELEIDARAAEPVPTLQYGM